MEALRMRDMWKRISLRHILLVWMVLAIAVLGASDAALLSSEDYFLFLPLGAFAVVLAASKSFSPREWLLRKNRSNAIAALAFAALTLLMLPIGRFLAGPMFSMEGMRIVWWNYAWQRMLYWTWNWTGLLGAVLLSVFGCWYAAISFCLRERGAAQAPLEPEKPLILGIYRWTTLIAAVGFVCVYSAAPGLFDQFDQAVIWNSTQAGEWSDFHPVAYHFFIRLCTLVIPSRRMVSLAFLAMWIYASNTAIGLLTPLHPKAGKWYAISTCLAFLPMLHLSTMFKDVPYSIALVALGLQILRILYGQGRKGWRWLGVGVWMYIALAFRHDGIAPVILTAIGLLIYCWRKRRALLRPLVLTVACAFALNFLVDNVLAFGILKADRHPDHMAFATPMYLLAAVADSGKEIDPEDQALMERVMPLSDWVASRYPERMLYTVDGPSREWGVPGERIFRVDMSLGIQYCRLTVKYLLRYPSVVLRALFTVNSLAWELTTPSPAAEAQQISYDLDALDRYDPKTFNGFALTGFSFLTMRYAQFLETTPVLRDVLVRGGVPLLCMLLGNYILWKKRRKEAILASLPVFFAWLIQFALLCAQLQRYLLPVREWMIFILLYACLAPPAPSAAGQRGPAVLAESAE